MIDRVGLVLGRYGLYDKVGRVLVVVVDQVVTVGWVYFMLVV